MSVVPVYVIMTTYDKGDGIRTKIAAESAGSIASKLVYPNLRWLITDDGSPQHEAHVKTIADSIHAHLPDMPVEVFNIERQGVGRAKNTALQHAFKETPVVLLTEDDWVLTERLDLLPYVQLLLDHANVGMIRFGYLGGDMQAKLKDYNDIAFWELVQGTGVYIYSGQISLRHQRLYDSVGFHAEHITPGAEELDYCMRYNAANNGADAPVVLWPAWNRAALNQGIFTNNGLSASLNNITPGS